MVKFVSYNFCFGISDQVEIKVIILEGQSWRELATTIIAGKSKWATFGGDHPQGLLPDPLKKMY